VENVQLLNAQKDITKENIKEYVVQNVLNANVLDSLILFAQQMV